MIKMAPHRNGNKEAEEETPVSRHDTGQATKTGRTDSFEGGDGVRVDSTRRREIVEHAMTHLPWGTGSEIRLRALRLARQAVMDCPPRASELLIMKAANDAVEEVALECRRRERKERWMRAAPGYLPFGATDEDELHTRNVAAAILDELPIDTLDYEVESRVRESLTALTKEIRLRQRKKELVRNGVSRVDGVLRELLQDDLISSDERWDSALRRDLEAAVHQELEEDLDGDETEHDVQGMVESIVEDDLGIEPTSDDDEEDYGNADEA